MMQESGRARSDTDLSQMIVWAQEETETRTERRKQEAIAKIKALAAQVNDSVSIVGTRAGPPELERQQGQ